MKSTFLFLIFLYNLFSEPCLSSDITEDGSTGKIFIQITSNIRSTDSRLYYNLKRLEDTPCSDGYVRISKKTENNQGVIKCFSIERKPVSAFALTLYNDEGVEDDDNNRTALAAFLMRPKIRAISKIKIHLIEEDDFQIRVEPEYYFPPPFNNN